MFVTVERPVAGSKMGLLGVIVTTSIEDCTAAFWTSRMNPCWSTVGGMACWTFRIVSRLIGASASACCSAASCAPKRRLLRLRLA